MEYRSDTQANDHGWYAYDSTVSWFDLMRNVKEWNFMARDVSYKGGGSYTGHLDNFSMKTVPEPSSMGLALVGLFTLLGYRRRRR